MPGTSDDARYLAEHAHRKQKDKLGEWYVNHLMRVAAAAKTEKETILAWLHDIVEDDHVSVVYIRTVFGDEIAEAVRAITHKPYEPLEMYYARVKANPLALAVKLLDIADNANPDRLKQLDEATMIRLALKYKKALEILTCSHQ